MIDKLSFTSLQRKKPGLKGVLQNQGISMEKKKGLQWTIISKWDLWQEPSEYPSSPLLFLPCFLPPLFPEPSESLLS